MASSAPRARQACALAADPAVAKTRAPRAWASWIAVVPMPEEPPCTRKLSPARRRPRPKTLVQTVKKVSGSAAAAVMPRPAGTGSAWSWWVSAYSA